MIERLTDITNSIAAFALVVAAWVGLRTWKVQLRGTAEYELARRILRATIQVRDEIARFRNRWAVVIEQHEAERSNESQSPRAPGWTPKFERAAYERAWQSITTARSNLEVELIEAEVLWGASWRRTAASLDDCLSELSRALRAHLQLVDEERRIRDDATLRAREALLEDDSPDGRDAFSSKVNQAVAQIETALRPYISSRSKK